MWTKLLKGQNRRINKRNAQWVWRPSGQNEIMRKQWNFLFFFRRIIWPVCELATWEWRKRMGEGEWGGERAKGALFVPSTTRWEESLLSGYKSVHAYHDELIQHGDILELRIAIEKQGSMICIGQSLFVQCLTKQNKTKQDKTLKGKI